MNYHVLSPSHEHPGLLTLKTAHVNQNGACPQICVWKCFCFVAEKQAITGKLWGFPNIRESRGVPICLDLSSCSQFAYARDEWFCGLVAAIPFNGVTQYARASAHTAPRTKRNRSAPSGIKAEHFPSTRTTDQSMDKSPLHHCDIIKLKWNLQANRSRLPIAVHELPDRVEFAWKFMLFFFGHPVHVQVGMKILMFSCSSDLHSISVHRISWTTVWRGILVENDAVFPWPAYPCVKRGSPWIPFCGKKSPRIEYNRFVHGLVGVNRVFAIFRLFCPIFWRFCGTCLFMYSESTTFWWFLAISNHGLVIYTWIGMCAVFGRLDIYRC